MCCFPLPSVEVTALTAEKDDASKTRLSAVKEELAKVREQLKPLRLQHDAEKQRNEKLREAQAKLTSMQAKLANAERDRNVALAADLKYGAIPVGACFALAIARASLLA